MRLRNSGIICRIAFALGIVERHWHGYILRSKSAEIGAVARGWRVGGNDVSPLDVALESSAGRNLRMRIRALSIVVVGVDGYFRDTIGVRRADIRRGR